MRRTLGRREGADIKRRIESSFFALCRELRTNPVDFLHDTDPFKTIITNYYHCAMEFIQRNRETPVEDLKDLVSRLIEARGNFIVARDAFLINKEKTLDNVIYGSMTLNEIKRLYNETIEC